MKLPADLTPRETVHVGITISYQHPEQISCARIEQIADYECLHIEMPWSVWDDFIMDDECDELAQLKALAECRIDRSGLGQAAHQGRLYASRSV